MTAQTVDECEAAGKYGGLRESRIAPYLYLLPALLPMLVFTYWPVLFSFVLGFLDWNLISPDVAFVGLRNYQELFAKDMTRIALLNTPKYLLGMAPFHIVIPLILAVLLVAVKSERLQNAYKAIVFSPTVLSFSVACMIFLWIYNPTYGLLNQLLAIFHVEPISWLSEKDWALWAIIWVTGWKVMGYNMIMFFAALVAIPSEYVEAAEIDGANWWQVFWNVKWPLISPTVFFVTVTTVSYAAEQTFIPINFLTRGGPYQTTSNLIFAIYQFAFQFFNAGVASALATVTFLIFLVVTYLQFRYLERFVHYEV